MKHYCSRKQQQRSRPVDCIAFRFIFNSNNASQSTCASGRHWQPQIIPPTTAFVASMILLYFMRERKRARVCIYLVDGNPQCACARIDHTQLLISIVCSLTQEHTRTRRSSFTVAVATFVHINIYTANVLLPLMPGFTLARKRAKRKHIHTQTNTRMHQHK